MVLYSIPVINEGVSSKINESALLVVSLESFLQFTTVRQGLNSKLTIITTQSR